MYPACYIVSGEANFMMTATNLTVGDFTQPGVARSLIEIPANSEKGLSHRFLWMFPNPLYKKFATLGKINDEFISNISECAILCLVINISYHTNV